MIDLAIFLCSLCIGLIYVYLTMPVTETIIMYPTPFNVGKVTYDDASGACFKYKIREAKCPIDKSQVKYFEPTY